MNSTHGLAALGGTTFGGALAAVLAGSFHMDLNLAANWVVVLAGVGTTIGGLLAWYIRWKYPTAPALPGEAVAIPADAPAVPVAIVQPPAPLAPPPQAAPPQPPGQGPPA